MGRNVYKVLSDVQAELHVPKAQYNAFGKYSYRSLEDIHEAVKPILEKHECGYFVSDDVVPIEGEEERVALVGKTQQIVTAKDRFYVKATVTFYLWEGGERITVSAYAREEAFKTGSDDAQITGMASSYARKYALCGLFNVDSGEDPDKDESGLREAQKPAKRQPKPATDKHKGEMAKLVCEFAELKGRTPDEVVAAACSTETIRSLGVEEGQLDFTDEQCVCLIGLLKTWIDKTKGEK